MSSTKEQKIQEALNRGVENIYPSRQELEAILHSGKKLRIYNGIDPTGPKLHLGHGVQLLKLRQLQELGHHIIVLIGDFTAQIGDPSDKLSARKVLTHKQVLENAKNYKKYIGMVLDLKETEIKYNSEWLGSMSTIEFIKLTTYFTIGQTLARDMFRERMKKGNDLFVNEFLYPVMQAYDSVAMDIDLEIGGKDQMFNMLAGRALMKKMKNKEKFVLTTKLLEDPSGKKMGKTEGNLVALDEKSEEMYGRIMSWPDELICVGFEIATNVPLVEVVQIKKEMEAGKNPKVLKMLLAYKMVELYHGTQNAISAEEHFKKVFEKKEAPKDLKLFRIKARKVIEVLVETGLCSSMSDARRNIKQGGIKIDGRVADNENIEITKECLLQKGKRFFIKVIPA